jgi:vitamin B12 transporter
VTKRLIVAALVLSAVLAAAAHVPADAAAAAPAAAPSASPSATPKAQKTLGDVFVTAQRTNTGQAGTPRETYVITQSELAQLGAVTIADALAVLPGVVLRDYGTAGHLQTILLRGASSTETLVLLNGRPVNEPGVGLFDFSSLPVSAVERIEVVEGAASTLYGSSAMGGVINIITRSPVAGAESDAQSSLGYQGAFAASAGAGFGSAEDDGVRLDLSTLHARDEFSYPAFEGTPSGSLTNDDANAEDAFATIAHPLGAVRAAVHLADDSDSDGEPGDVVFGQSEFARQQRYFLRSDMTLELPEDDNDIFLQAYSDGQRLHYYDGTPFESYDTLSHLTTRGFGVRDTFEDGDNTITAGYDARGDRAEFDATYYGIGPSSMPGTESTTALYASDELRDGPALTWTFGLRSERPQGFANTQTPSAGVLWKDPSGESGFRLNYDRAFRVPALEETSPFFFGNPRLEPEYAATYDAGYFSPGGSITYFGMRASNLIVSEPPDFVPENVSMADVSGVNVDLRSSDRHGDSADLSYTDYLVATDLTDRNRLPFRPTTTGSLRLSHAKRSQSYGVILEYVGRNFANDPNTLLVPQFAALSAYWSKNIGKASALVFRVDNITGERVEVTPGYPVLGTTASATISTTSGR